MNSTRSQLNRKLEKAQVKRRDKPSHTSKLRQQKSPSLADAVINDHLSPNFDPSSEEEESIKQIQLGKPFKLRRRNCSYCQGYIQHKGCRLPKKYSNLFTANKFRKPGEKLLISQRLFLSNENGNSEDRRMLPVLIINIDGVLGYWNVSSKIKHFVLRHGVVDSLIRLSYDFRLVAVSSQSQKNICRLVHGLMNSQLDQTSADDSQPVQHLFFDAVYQLNAQNLSSQHVCRLRNIDEIQFDLSQVLQDLQFRKKPQQKSDKESKADLEQSQQSLALKSEGTNFQTFWESSQYRVHKKVIIVTTEKHFPRNTSYSYDFNHVF